MRFSSIFLLSLFLLCISFSSAFLGREENRLDWAASPPAIQTAAPIIGILSVVCEDYCSPTQQSYFAASYVKTLESGGGRVVPVPYDTPEKELYALLDQLNGILFTGGDADLDMNHPYYRTERLIIAYIKKVHSQGDYFPIWGTCLGFESLLLAYAEQNSSYPMLTSFDSENYTIPLNFTNLGLESRIFHRSPEEFGQWPESSQAFLAGLPITMNNHRSGYSPAALQQNPIISSEFNILSTNLDRQGKEFVSLVEHQNFPIYASQFHPEKIPFEFPNEVIVHSSQAIVGNSYLMAFFVQECRRNARKFSIPYKEIPLIYNYPATRLIGKSFEQIYIFPLNHQQVEENEEFVLYSKQ